MTAIEAPVLTSTSPTAIHPPPLSRGLKLGYGVGSMAEALVFSSTTQFLLIFYNQVRGLNAGYVGMAIAAGLFVNAVADPLVGSWSDRTRSRFGRRHPFMFAAILPVALAFWGLFNPPAGLGMWGQLVWLAVLNIVLQQALTLFHTPHLAFGGELSPDYIERTKVMSYNTFFLWAGDTACWLSTFGLFFAASRAFPNGALDPSRYLGFSTTVALLVGAILLLSSASTARRIRWMPKPAAGAKGFSLPAFFGDVKQALSNRNYLTILFSMLFLSLMQGVRGGLWIYTATFFWRLDNSQIVWFAAGSFIAYVAGSAWVSRIHRRFDKRATVTAAIALYCIGPALPLALGYVGVLSAQTPGILVILIAFGLLQHFPYCLIATTQYSALADITDENEVKYGVRQEGVFFSTQTFFARIDQAVGSALAGWVLSLLAFPAHAVPGHVPQPVLQGLALAFVVSTAPGLVGAVCASRLRLSAASHKATRETLAARAEAPAG